MTVIKNFNKDVCFRDIKIGTVFKTSSRLFHYVKIDIISIKNDSVYSVNCIDLDNGHLFFMEDDKPVYIPEGNIKFYGKPLETENKLSELNVGDWFVQPQSTSSLTFWLFIKIKETTMVLDDNRETKINTYLWNGPVLYLADDESVYYIDEIIIKRNKE